MPYYMIYVLALHTFHATDDDTIPCTSPTVLVDNSEARFSSSVFSQQQLPQAAQTSLQVSPGKSANLERMESQLGWERRRDQRDEPAGQAQPKACVLFGCVADSATQMDFWF
jgi:hypothetical protein